MTKTVDYVVLTSKEVKQGNETKTFFQRIGVGFKTKDGKGISVVLNCLPINGRLLIKKYEPKKQQQSQTQQKPIEEEQVF